MNLKKIALEAGVSVSTVSKAFNNAEDISEKTKNRIFSIAKMHGCYGKYIKKKYSKKVIAVICPEINSEYYGSIIENLKISIEAHGAIMVISEYNFARETFVEQLEYFSGYLRVDGIITFSSLNIPSNDIDTPIVVIGKSSKCKIGYVHIDIYSAVKNAVLHLKELKHNHIAFIGDQLTGSKREMFSECMKELMMPLMADSVITVNSRFEDAGYRAADLLLKTECTAAICAYDNIAFGVIDRLNELGYRIPDDYSIIGMDNIRASEYRRESLTTISYPVRDMCEKSVEILIDMIKHRCSANNNAILNPELIIRGSTSEKQNKNQSI